MSSSNIIKTAKAGKHSISAYRFEPVADYSVRQSHGEAPPGFVSYLDTFPPALGGGGSHHEYGDDGADHSSELMIAGVSEEENARQVQESFDRGFEEGKRQAERGLTNVFKALRDAVEDTAALRGQVLRETEEDILKLVITVSRKVIHQEIATDRLILAKIVAAAVNSASERDEVVVRLNPEDYRQVSAHRQIYLNGCGDDRQLELKSDDTVSPGGCIVETATGEIDARTETQLDEVFRRLLDERNNQIEIHPAIIVEREPHAYEEN
jgi:flagellar assembly protein FliH